MYAAVPGFPNFKLNAYIWLNKSRDQTARVVLDTGAGPTLIGEDFLPQRWKQFRRPIRVRFLIFDAI